VKIGLLIYGGLETISGGYIYDRYLVDFLNAQGQQVDLISLPWRHYGAHLGDNVSGSLYARLTDLEVDCLVQDQLCHPSLFHLNWRLKGKVGYPIISLVHHLRSSEVHPRPAKRIYHRVERAYLESVDGFIFNSRTTLNSVQRFVPQLPKHVVAFPGGDGLGEGLDEAQVRHRAQTEGPLRVVFLGSLTRRKGLKTLMEACEQLEEGRVKLSIIGSHSAEPRHARKIGSRVERLRSKMNIHVLNALPTAELPKWLRDQDLLVVPSSYEGFGIVYLEGMAFGLPAIATTRGAAHEIINHGQNGFLIEPGDSQALARHLNNLFSDRAKLLSMSLKALETHKSCPTWNGMAQRIHEFLLSF